MLMKLKRSKSTAFPDLPEQPHSYAEEVNPSVANLPGATSELLVQSLASGRTSAGVLGAFLGELNSMPHLPFPTPSTEREELINELNRVDMLFAAAEKARKELHLTWKRTKYHFQAESNRCALDGEDDADGIILDGCAICGVPKTECMQQDKHFGKDGESPPYAKCSHCCFNARNLYDSARELQLHVDAKHPPKSQ